MWNGEVGMLNAGVGMTKACKIAIRRKERIDDKIGKYSKLEMPGLR